MDSGKAVVALEAVLQGPPAAPLGPVGAGRRSRWRPDLGGAPGSVSGAESPLPLPGQVLRAQFSLSSRSLFHQKAAFGFMDCDALRTGERGPGGASGGRPASLAPPSSRAQQVFLCLSSDITAPHA